MSANNYSPYNNIYGNETSPPSYNMDTERLRHYLRHLFEDVEKHVVSSHIPLETTCQILGGDVRRDFGGVRVHYHPERFAHCVECFCGMHWQLSVDEFRYRGYGDADRIIEEFCSRINYTYGARNENRTTSYMTFAPKIEPLPNLKLTMKAQAELAERKAEEEERKAKEKKRKAAEEKSKAKAAEEFKKALESVPDEVKEQLGKLF